MVDRPVPFVCVQQHARLTFLPPHPWIKNDLGIFTTTARLIFYNNWKEIVEDYRWETVPHRNLKTF
jgi:hypothetical protein